MKRLFSLAVLFILSVQFVSLVFAQAGIPVQPREGGLTQEEIEQFSAQREQKELYFNIGLWITIILSIIISIFITKSMIRKNPKIINWIIHVIVALGSLTIFIIVIVDGGSCIVSPYCTFPSIYLFFIAVSVLSTIFSLFIIKALIKKKTGINYRVNMSSSMFFLLIIFSLLEILMEFIVQPAYDIPAFLFLPLLSVPIMLGLYSILGLIGYFIDKKNN